MKSKVFPTIWILAIVTVGVHLIIMFAPIKRPTSNSKSDYNVMEVAQNVADYISAYGVKSVDPATNVSQPREDSNYLWVSHFKNPLFPERNWDLRWDERMDILVSNACPVTYREPFWPEDSLVHICSSGSEGGLIGIAAINDSTNSKFLVPDEFLNDILIEYIVLKGLMKEYPSLDDIAMDRLSQVKFSARIGGGCDIRGGIDWQF
ncbi:MAG: hypothetical protein AB1746_04550 [Candidatus Zixiibacteriota bacterium]